jgi:hypothetical protein
MKAPCLRECVELATAQKRRSSFFSSSSVGEGSCLNSMCPRQTALSMLPGLTHLRKKGMVWISVN